MTYDVAIPSTYHEQTLLSKLPKAFKYFVIQNGSVLCFHYRPIRAINTGTWKNTHPYSPEAGKANIHMFRHIFTSFEENVVYEIVDVIGERADAERYEKK